MMKQFTANSIQLNSAYSKHLGLNSCSSRDNVQYLLTDRSRSLTRRSCPKAQPHGDRNRARWIISKCNVCAWCSLMCGQGVCLCTCANACITTRTNMGVLYTQHRKLQWCWWALWCGCLTNNATTINERMRCVPKWIAKTPGARIRNLFHLYAVSFNDRHTLSMQAPAHHYGTHNLCIAVNSNRKGVHFLFSVITNTARCPLKQLIKHSQRRHLMRKHKYDGKCYKHFISLTPFMLLIKHF